MTTQRSFFEKHAAKIEFGAPSGCWLWSGAQWAAGYGKGWKHLPEEGVST